MRQEKWETNQRQIGSWYDDESWFTNLGSPWTIRSWQFSRGLGAGIFSFDKANGYSEVRGGFRIVLSI